MDKESLVESLIDESVNLIQFLDKEDCGVRAALWHYYNEVGAWKLILSSDKFAPKSQREFYLVVAKVINKNNLKLSVSDIKLVSMGDAIIQALSMLVHVSDFGRARFSQSTFNGIYIEDAIVLRMQK